MVTYQYTAISHNGEKVNGVVEAYNELDAVDRIKQTCDVVLKMKEVKNGDEGSFLTRDIGGEKLDAKAFTLMCSQFAIIIRSGVPIARTVRLIAEKTTNKPLKKMLKNVASDVESGRSLAASFEERGKKILPPTFVETIRAGEESGTVDKSFESMQEHFEKQAKS
ncbi:MAG: type II secretion system F family protein [Firmicutes bacterium]|nr:type II secretion system F family protein [Bacillota bacterium]